MAVSWQHGHEGALYADVPAVRLEVYPPTEDWPMWMWWAVEFVSGRVLGRGQENEREDAQRAAEACA